LKIGSWAAIERYGRQTPTLKNHYHLEVEHELPDHPKHFAIHHG